MSLKGYQWLDNNNKVIMSYTFKYCELDIWQDTTEEELNNFIQYLKDHYCDKFNINYNNHIVK